MNRTRTAPAIAWLLISAFLLSLFASVGSTRNAHAQVSEEFELSSEVTRAALSTYTTDLTRLASQGKLESVQGFDAEIDRANSNASAAAP